MAAPPRLNSVIRALEEGKTAITTFVSPPSVDGAIALSTSAYDGVVFEYEHHPYDIRGIACSTCSTSRRPARSRPTAAPAG
jgi:4-hydroxy-2-oxoheptanedioate aldolase